MSETKWTKENLGMRKDVSGDYCVDSRDGYSGYATFWGKDDVAEGNAYLFAAADDLYKALELTLNLLQSMQPGCDCAACTNARAALLKANPARKETPDGN